MATVIKQASEAVASIFGRRTEQQPKYTVLETVGDVEVREYEPRLAAETAVQGKGEATARGEAFHRLAGYIFGGNRIKQSIAMTAPVENRMDGAGLTMRFFLPPSFTADKAPIPNDPLVKILAMESETIATVTYSGTWSADIQNKHAALLLRTLASSGWQPKGAPFAQLYDPPFTLPWLRRNETAVRVSKA